MRYVLAKAKEKAEADAYRIYISDSLFFMAQGKAPSMRVREWIEQNRSVAQDDEEPPEADEIIASMKDKLERLVNS